MGQVQSAIHNPRSAISVSLIPPIPGVKLPAAYYGVNIVDWAYPLEGRARLLDDPRLDKLTRVHPMTPLAIFMPVVGYFFWRSVAVYSLSAWTTAGLALAGLAFWTLAEYSLHRGLFHFTPRSKPGLVLAYLIHGVHHAYPDDSRKLVMPPVVSIPLALLFYLLFTLGLGTGWGDGFFAGFIVGYLCYDMTHYIVHAVPVRNPVALALKKNHMRHHFQAPDRRFGVSNTFWDYVFGTR